MAVKKLSAITNAPAAPALTDTAVGVGGGSTDYQFSFGQIASVIGGIALQNDTTTLYVTSSGNDTSGVGSVAAPWLTLQHAINQISQLYNFCGHKLTLSVGSGSFAGFGVRSMTGGGVLLIKGAGPTSTTITAGVNDGLFCFGDCITFNEAMSTVLCVDQLELAPGATGNYLNLSVPGVTFCFGDWIVFSGTLVYFGTCATTGISVTAASSLFFAPGNCWHLASTQQVFMLLEYGGSVSILSEVHWDGTCTWSTAAFQVGDGGKLYIFSPDFHDASLNTGTQIQIFFGGFVLFNTDLNLFPGTNNTYSIASGGVAISGFTPAHGTPPTVDNQAITSFDFLGTTPMTYSLIFPAGNTGNTYETPRDGWMAYVSDAVVNQIGAVVNQGGGSNKVLVRFNGTDWVVFAANGNVRQELTGTTTLYISNLSGTLVGGSSYTTGTYVNVALTGGSGSGAKANIQVAGGAVTVVSPYPTSSTYAIGDVLSAAAANIGGTGSGFTFTITAIGNDTTGNGTTAKPFASLTGAYSYAKNTFDLAGNMVVLQLINGAYGALYFSAGWVGNGFVQVLGNTSNVDAVVVDPTISSDNYAFFNLDPIPHVTFVLGWLQLRSNTGTLAFDAPIKVRLWDQVHGGGHIHFRFRTSGAPQISMGTGTWLEDFSDVINLDYTDSGAATQRSFLDMDGICFSDWQSISAITGSPAWSDGFIKLTGEASCQYNLAAGFSASGATGNKALLNGGGVLETFGAGAAGLPGNAGPILNGGMWYDGFSQIYESAAFRQVITVTYNNLPSPVTYPGAFARISDSTTNTPGATVTAGSGGDTVMLLSDGTHWRVLTGY